LRPVDQSYYPDQIIIGKDVWFGKNVSIGDIGFGFQRNEQGTGYIIPLERLPHPFGVIIEDGVEIGSNSTVHRGKWRDTKIGEGTKIDSLVHIAHNVVIGKNVLVVAGSVIGGSVTIGDGCFIGENVSILQAVTIADHVTLGAGAVVLADISQADSTWAGVPAVKIADVQNF
jgi:UDP-3-O-[3-hydroxymyristoyl] glucosamine N-acyltransferase